MSWRGDVLHLVSMTETLRGCSCAVVLITIGLFLSSGYVRAASLTEMKDVMSRQKISTASNHEIRFTTPSGVQTPTDTITLIFPSGFDLTAIDAADILLSHGVSTGFETTETVAASAAAGSWGASVSGQTITLSPPLDAGAGEIAASHVVIVRIGTAAGAGASQIVNPSSADLYPLHIGGVFGDTGGVILPISAGDSLGVTVTIPAPSSGGSGTGGGGAATVPPPPPPPPPPPAPPPVPPPPPPAPPPAAGSDGGAAAGSGTGSAGSGGSSSGGGGTAASGGSSGGGGVASLAIREVQVTAIDDRSALLSWETDTQTRALVEFGSPGFSERITDETLQRQHTVRLTRLTPSTFYQVRITARAPSGMSSVALSGFRTLDDVTPPANPLELRVIGQDRQVVLEWTHPATDDFADVVVIAREDRFPTGALDGRLVYAGSLTAAIDTGLEAGREYFYAVFARDRVGNLSTGAVASARTWGALVSAEPLFPGLASSSEPGGASSPSATISRTISPEWRDASGSLVLRARADGAREAFVGQGVRVFLPATVEADGERIRIQSAFLWVGEDRYQLRADTERFQGRETWSTIVQLTGQNEVDTRVEAYFQDGSRGDVRARFALSAKGLIQGSEDEPMEGAEIRVLQEREGEFVVWDPRTSGQTNPFITLRDGRYGFLVEPGRYRLLVRREGWLSVEQDVQVTGNLLHPAIRLRRPSQVVAFLENTLEATREVLQSPAVQEVNQQVVAPLAVAVAVTNLTTAASTASLFHYAYFIFTQPVLLFGRRKRKQWGVVYNALSKQAVDLAIVRLLDAGTGRVMQTRITDGQGRYSFSVQPGMYRLQVIKQGFVFPTVYLKDDKEDGEMIDLYHGESIKVVHEAALAVNIPIDPPEKKEEPITRTLWKRRLRQLQQVGALIGVGVSGVSLTISPTWVTGGLFGLQVATYFLFRRLALPPKPKDWGIVYDAGSKKALGQAVVRIFDTRFHKLLETQVTDARGKYAFFAGQGVYQVTADKQGYEGYKSQEIDLRKTPDKVVAEKIHLQQKNG